MERRSYRNEQDITLLQNFNAAAIKKSGGCGYLHPGFKPWQREDSYAKKIGKST